MNKAKKIRCIVCNKQFPDGASGFYHDTMFACGQCCSDRATADSAFHTKKECGAEAIVEET